MTEVTDFVAAIVAIAKDPKTFEKSLGDAAAAQEKLAEARKLRKEADDIRKAGEADLEKATYERGQGERAAREAGSQSTANAARAHELDARERNVKAREDVQQQNEANLKRNLEQREKDLEMRERVAQQKLNEASKLMASYDAAKHQAALKLAG